jgi:hypothetical protein
MSAGEPHVELAAETLAILEVIGLAIRQELGTAIDAYPGARRPEGADPINRAYRAVVLALARHAAGDVPPAVVSRALRHLAEWRLVIEGWDEGRLRALIEQEPGSPDDWLAFLILSSRSQIAPLLRPEPESS